MQQSSGSGGINKLLLHSHLHHAQVHPSDYYAQLKSNTAQLWVGQKNVQTHMNGAHATFESSVLIADGYQREVDVLINFSLSNL